MDCRASHDASVRRNSEGMADHTARMPDMSTERSYFSGNLSTSDVGPGVVRNAGIYQRARCARIRPLLCCFSQKNRRSRPVDDEAADKALFFVGVQDGHLRVGSVEFSDNLTLTAMSGLADYLDLPIMEIAPDIIHVPICVFDRIATESPTHQVSLLHRTGPVLAPA